MYYFLIFMSGALAACHPELRGEEPHQADIDNGQCMPIKCDVSGVPPAECTKLCALRKYVPTCNTVGGFCLCQHLVGDSVELVSPDEIMDQPSSAESNSFSIFAVILPLRDYFSQDVTPTVSSEPLEVNVHDGRLYWDFRFILTGLLLLMLALVIYELVMCRVQYYEKPDEKDEPKKKVLNV